MTTPSWFVALLAIYLVCIFTMSFIDIMSDGFHMPLAVSFNVTLQYNITLHYIKSHYNAMHRDLPGVMLASNAAHWSELSARAAQFVKLERNV